MRYYHLYKPLTVLLLVLCLLLPAGAQDIGADPPEGGIGSGDPALLGENETPSDGDEYIIAEEDYTEDEPWIPENGTADRISTVSGESALDDEAIEEGLAATGSGILENQTLALPASLSARQLWNSSARERITSTSLSADGSYAVAGTHRPGAIYYFDCKGAVQWVKELHVPVFGVSISPDGTYIAAAAEKLYLLYPHGGEVWSNDTGYFVYSVAVSREGDRIAAGYDDGNIRLFDRSGDLLWNYTAEDNVISTAIASDGSYVAAGSKDHQIYFLDSNGNLLWKYKTGDSVQGVSLSSDGSFLGAGSGDRVAYFLDARGNLLWRYEAENRINAISVSPEGTLAGICEGSRVHLFDREGRSLWDFDTGSGGSYVSTTSIGTSLGPDATTVALSSNGLHLIVGTGSGDQRVYYYSLEAPAEPPFLEASASIKAPIEALEESLLQPAGDEQSVQESAYISSITRTGPNQNSPVAIRIAVSPDWIASRPGGIGGIRVTERANNGVDTVLETTVVGYDLQNNTVFEAVSMNRSTTYGLASNVTERRTEQPIEWWNLRPLLGGNETGTLRILAGIWGTLPLQYLIDSIAGT